MDPKKCRDLVGRVVSDAGGAFTVGLGYLGDRLGLFRALAERGACGSADLAASTGLNERYVREWLKGMAAAEYLEHDPETDRYFLTPEQAAVLADEHSPFFAAGALHYTVPSLSHATRLADCFRTGGGIPYADLGEEIAEAIDRLHRPWFDHLLAAEWLPAAPGLKDRLERGIRVLDVGCGFGRSTLAVGAAFPRSRIVGIDPDPASIRRGRERAAERGLPNVALVEATVETMPRGELFDLVLAIDCIHDMRDPVGALRAIRGLLAAGGSLFWTEPTGSANPLENRNPIGRLRATLSPFHCLTVSLAEGGAGLGTLIGETGARRLAAEAGFGRFERVPVDSPFQQFFLLSGI